MKEHTIEYLRWLADGIEKGSIEAIRLSIEIETISYRTDHVVEHVPGNVKNLTVVFAPAATIGAE